ASLANGAAIADADPVAAGPQGATIGTNAFASVNAGIAALPSFGTLVVNGSYTGGGSGVYHEDVKINKSIVVLLQAGPVTLDSLPFYSQRNVDVERFQRRPGRAGRLGHHPERQRDSRHPDG